jgi:hypothetical protein
MCCSEVGVLLSFLTWGFVTPPLTLSLLRPPRAVAAAAAALRVFAMAARAEQVSKDQQLRPQDSAVAGSVQGGLSVAACCLSLALLLGSGCSTMRAEEHPEHEQTTCAGARQIQTQRSEHLI